LRGGGRSSRGLRRAVLVLDVVLAMGGWYCTDDHVIVTGVGYDLCLGRISGFSSNDLVEFWLTMIAVCGVVSLLFERAFGHVSIAGWSATAVIRSRIHSHVLVARLPCATAG
jgi:hypothetical protein